MSSYIFLLTSSKLYFITTWSKPFLLDTSGSPRWHINKSRTLPNVWLLTYPYVIISDLCYVTSLYLAILMHYSRTPQQYFISPHSCNNHRRAAHAPFTTRPSCNVICIGITKPLFFHATVINFLVRWSCIYILCIECFCSYYWLIANF